jgi:hypothetical protein
VPLLAHLGIGLAAKRILPQIPVWILIICAFLLDILAIFLRPVWKAHGLLMAIIWTLLTIIIVRIIFSIQQPKMSQDHASQKSYSISQTSWLMGGIIFSHWILDFIGWPLSVWVPDPTGIPFFFSDTPNYGLGVYRTWTGALIMDLGILLFGILIFNSWKNKALIKDS